MSVKHIQIDFGFYILFAIFLLLLPLKLVFSWSIAVAVHEAGHYIALRFFNIDVTHISLGAGGVSMQIGEITTKQEFVCALAGPMGSLSLLLLSRCWPCTAICGFVHCLFNLLPIYPLDGGRALRCLLIKLFGCDIGITISKWLGVLLCSLAVVILFVLAYKVYLGAAAVIVIGYILIKFKLANNANK